MSIRLDYEDQDKIAGLLVGRRITTADIGTGTLTLDNGTVIKVIPNQGGCSCSAGDYELSRLATVDNAITSVRLVNDPANDDYDWSGPSPERGGYRIYVVTANEEIEVVAVDGDDGNGYYGTGYELLVSLAEGSAA